VPFLQDESAGRRAGHPGRWGLDKKMVQWLLTFLSFRRYPKKSGLDITTRKIHEKDNPDH
jgi:hypothetical protein